MKVYRRYIVFGFDSYYPDGGFNDYLGDFDSLEDIDEKIDNSLGFYTFNGISRKYYQIFDCEERVLVQSVPGRVDFVH